MEMRKERAGKEATRGEEKALNEGVLNLEATSEEVVPPGHAAAGERWESKRKGKERGRGRKGGWRRQGGGGEMRKGGGRKEEGG